MSFWLFCAYARINDFPYAEKDMEYSQYENDLLTNSQLPTVEFKQSELCTEYHTVNSSRVVWVATRKASVPEELNASYRKAEFASLVQLKYILKNSVFIEKTLSCQTFVLSESIECCV